MSISEYVAVLETLLLILFGSSPFLNIEFLEETLWCLVLNYTLMFWLVLAIIEIITKSLTKRMMFYVRKRELNQTET
jgi:hypothetical protein